jgi:hypothetical protein
LSAGRAITAAPAVFATASLSAVIASNGRVRQLHAHKRRGEGGERGGSIS